MLCHGLAMSPSRLSVGAAYPLKTTWMICCRSTHIDSASFTFGSSSSLCCGLYGFEFQVMFVISPPG